MAVCIYCGCGNGGHRPGCQREQILAKKRQEAAHQAAREAPEETQYRSLSEETRGQIQLLDTLIDVAQRTTGAELWRMLFAEMRHNLLEQPGGKEDTPRG